MNVEIGTEAAQFPEKEYINEHEHEPVDIYACVVCIIVYMAAMVLNI